MGSRLSAQELELYKRCDEVLHYIWDPIGVSGEPTARDEYHSYLPQVFRLLCDGALGDTIADYLAEVETESMGLETSRASAERAATVLLEYRDWIARRDP